MSTFLTLVVVALCFMDVVSTSADQQSSKTQRISKRRAKKLCSTPSLCFSSSTDEKALPATRQNTNCKTDLDCSKGEYCHSFHRLCLRPLESVTVAPVKTSAKKCVNDSNCKSREYCHEMWRICLPSPATFKSLPTKRPSWYCDSDKDCKIDQACHKTFHACHSRPRVPAVRRSTGNSRKCESQDGCGPKFYCHDHFRICLPRATADKVVVETHKSKRCVSERECPKGMLCHSMWKICFTPAQSGVVQRNKSRQCQHDSDCKKNEFCHIMAGPWLPVIARHRRNVESVCLPLISKESQTTEQRRKCNTNDDCEPNRCCLGKLGVCLRYQLPDEMCLLEQIDFACPCVSGSFCKSRGKSASPKRMINKMKLPESVAEHVMRGSHKRKHKVGKCIPE